MSILASGFAKSCMHFLDQAPQPPSMESVQSAMNVLYDVGAIERIGPENTTQQSERLTPLGFHLAKLPVVVKLGKMQIFGAFFWCIDPILTIAASLSSKSPFASFISDAAVAKAKQRVFEDADSDFMAYCNVGMHTVKQPKCLQAPAGDFGRRIISTMLPYVRLEMLVDNFWIYCAALDFWIARW